MTSPGNISNIRYDESRATDSQTELMVEILNPEFTCCRHTCIHKQAFLVSSSCFFVFSHNELMLCSYCHIEEEITRLSFQYTLKY